jgi:hypothetical protein
MIHSLIYLLCRRKYSLSVKVRARLLTTIPDSTSQKFVLVGSLSRKDTKPEGKHVVVFLDFAGMRDRQCHEVTLKSGMLVEKVGMSALWAIRCVWFAHLGLR